MARFAHLHTHSHYSFLQALPKIEELVAKAKKEGADALALTDAGNLHGAIDFYKETIKAGIRPIIGVDAYIAPRSRFEQDRTLEEKRSRLVLLAKNEKGYRNLLVLVTKSFTEGFFERPRMDRELLKEHAEGLIALVPSFAGDVPALLAAGDADGASAALAEHTSIFGSDNVYLEITNHPSIENHEKNMKRLSELSKASGVPLVAQHDVYYLNPEDRNAREVMRRIQSEGRRRDYNEQEDFSFVSEIEMFRRFSEIPEAVERSQKIAERCSLSFELGKWVFPEFHLPPGRSHAEELRAQAYRGLSARGLSEKDPKVCERLEYELKIINDKGFSPYFLIVADLLAYAKPSGILTTPRGSAAGSLVSYSVGITNVDPLAYQLPFERFLNPERPKAPDIDMDFADNRRDEMIGYVKKKYGEDRVAQIGTFGTMLARAAVRDITRALGHAYGTGDRIAKLIPIGSQGFPMTIEKALELEPDLKTLYDEEDDVREIIDLSRRIEGCFGNFGLNSAGVVIAPTPLVDWTPLQFDPKGGKLITQYDMYALTDEYGGVGLLKFDFLGIKNLSILADSVERVRETQGMQIDIENIPLDDTKTYTMLARGETEGTFQLNGSGMTRFLKELKPTKIHDINAMVALYRPGPMEVIPSYIERKNNPRLVRYLDPRMEKYLKESYGLIVYQEDVLLSAIELAGYSWLEADKFRKAMGKKLPAEMAAQKERFARGVIEKGQTKEFAERLWKLFEPFQSYAFNKAHAASYGKVAYQTSYMKANYPVEYMAALLTADAGDVEEIARLVGECSRLLIPVLPPDVNESGTRFTVVTLQQEGAKKNKAIRFGLSSIKNFGEGIAEAIISERKERGPFETLADFLSRVGTKNLNHKSLEALIQCGALDRFAERGVLMANVEPMLAFHRDATVAAPQESLFGASASRPEFRLVLGHSTSMLDKLAWEKELLGIYVSGHPLDAHQAMLKKAKTSIARIKEESQAGLPVTLPVLVETARPILTKGGEKMSFVKLTDKTDSLEAVVFPRLFKEHGALFSPGACLLVQGTVSNRNGEISLALENARVL